MSGHERGPMVGFAADFHAVCACGDRFDGISPGEVRDLHEQHLVEVTRPELRQAARRGLDRARGALAETIARGKHEPQEEAS